MVGKLRNGRGDQLNFIKMNSAIEQLKGAVVTPENVVKLLNLATQLDEYDVDSKYTGIPEEVITLDGVVVVVWSSRKGGKTLQVTNSLTITEVVESLKNMISDLID